MADTTTTCPHCDEEITLFLCKECRVPAVRNEEEVCETCEKSFCPGCRGDHTCEDPGEEDEEDEDVE